MTKLIFKLFILFYCLAGNISATSQDSIPKKFILDGHFTNPSSGFVFLVYSNSDIDSCFINDGNFKFSGSLDEPVKAYLLTHRPGSNDTNGFDYVFYIEPGELNFIGEFRNNGKYELIGSKTDRDRVRLFHQDSAIKTLVQLNYNIATDIYNKIKTSNNQEKILLKGEIDSIATVIVNLKRWIQFLLLIILNHLFL